MNLRLPAVFAALGCVFLASCTPYNEHPNKKPTQKPVQKSVTTVEQQQVQAQRDAMKQKEALKKKAALPTAPAEMPSAPASSTPSSTASSTPAPETPKPPTEEKRADYKFANKVPGKEGFVFSPYNNKVVDVRDMPSGTLVQDPTYTGAGKGYFRVP
jgi:CCR4-NOT transcriptional regulation complex NOT5 subunit